MNIDFAFWLTIAVLITGALWLLDVLYLRKRRKENEEANFVVEFGVSFFPVLFIVFVLRSFLYEPFQIPSSSMEPTLEIGDFILVNKYSYGLRLPVIGTKMIPVGQPERGDVMVFFPPNDPRYFIKRVIGLPGDKIQITNNRLIINGVAADQKLISALPSDRPFTLLEEDLLGTEHVIRTRVPPTFYGREGEWTVPEGHYFMMGDNRDNSLDSREWGFVPEANVVGKAVAIWMHWEGFNSLPSFDRTGRIE